MHIIKFPYAIDKNSNEIVSVTDVSNGKSCNCICFCCKEEMIAINSPNNKQEPHFRHHQNSKCNVNFESFIHWITKEVIKEITIIFLPSPKGSELERRIDEKLMPLFNIQKTPKKLRELIITELFQKIESLNRIEIQNISIEESFKTSKGNIKVDIVLRFRNKSNQERILFIEPYFSNQIDSIKLSKIKELNISTISIDLIKFINKKSHFFNIKDLKDYIINNLEGKKWEFYNVDNLINMETIKNRIKTNRENIAEYRKKIKVVKDIYESINILESKIIKLDEEVITLRGKVRNIYKDIDSIDYL